MNTQPPSILIAYPSCFHYPDFMGRVEIKTSQVLLASYLAQFFPVEYADFEITIGRPETSVQLSRFQRKVRQFLSERPVDILALSCWTSLSWQATMAVARIWRELYPDKLIVIGGYHPSARPDDFTTHDNLIDYIICGEGELALESIAREFPTKGRPEKTTVVYAPTIHPDQFVGYNWDLVEPFVRENLPNGLTEFCIYLSRGCPFGCAFCMEAMKDRRWRPYSVEQSIEEIERAVARFNLHAVAIADACFGVRPSWRKQFLRELVNRKPKYWVVVETRPEYLDDEDIGLLAELKCEIQLGIESCSPAMLQIMNKTKTPERFLAHFRHISHLMTDHKILHRANLLFNHPGETRQTVDETLAFVDAELEHDSSYLIWAPVGYMHFPGCDLDRNRVSYEQQYGCRVDKPEWWKGEEDQYYASSLCSPSSDLDNGNRDYWKRQIETRDEAMRSALAPPAFRFAARKYNMWWMDDHRFSKT